MEPVLKTHIVNFREVTDGAKANIVKHVSAVVFGQYYIEFYCQNGVEVRFVREAVLSIDTCLEDK
jgi:hypothetical protein